MEAINISTIQKSLSSNIFKKRFNIQAKLSLNHKFLQTCKNDATAKNKLMIKFNILHNIIVLETPASNTTSVVLLCVEHDGLESSIIFLFFCRRYRLCLVSQGFSFVLTVVLLILGCCCFCCCFRCCLKFKLLLFLFVVLLQSLSLLMPP